MKITKWLPRILITAGIVIMAIAVWDITSTNMESNETLSKAKQMIAEKKKAPQPIAPQQDGTAQKSDSQDKVVAQPAKAKIGDTVGILQIPRIDAELAIVEGTDPNDLKKGVGHYKGSSFPGEHGQIVLSGHRDTVFRSLGELKIGDSLTIETAKGSTTYKINHTKIVDSKDTSIITLQKQKEELILTTCYPFRYVGNAPKRYIIYANPI